MSADISTSITGQVQAFFVVGENRNRLPWHNSGTFFEKAPSWEEMMIVTGFNNDLVMRSIWVEAAGTYVQVPGKCAVIDTTDRKVLGVVSDRFSLQQRYHWAGQLRTLVDDHGLELDSGGLLKDGKTSWLNFRTNQVADIRPGDPVRNNVLAADGCTGLRGSMLGRVVTRTVCANTEASALAEGTMLKLSHRGDIQAKWGDLVRAYSISFDGQVEQWRAMANKYVSRADLDRFITDLTGKTADQEKRSGGHRDKIIQAFESGVGSKAESAWDMFNAVTEVVTYSKGSGTQGAMNALNSQWFGDGAKMIARAQSLIMGAM